MADRALKESATASLRIAHWVEPEDRHAAVPERAKTRQEEPGGREDARRDGSKMRDASMPATILTRHRSLLPPKPHQRVPVCKKWG
jgi:hypothetical protein